MKKIISLVAAVAMMSTLFVASVSAESKTVTYTISDPVEITAADVKTVVDDWVENEYIEDQITIPTGYKAYKFTLDMSGVGTLSKSGRRLGSFQLDMKCESGEISTTQLPFAYEAKIADASYWVPGTSANGKYSIGYYASNAKSRYADSSDTITDAVTAVVFAKEGTKINLTGQLGIYDSTEQTITEEYPNDTQGNVLTCTPGTITLGKASVAVTGVSVNAATTMVVGGTQQATATVLPVDATNKAVTWSSSDSDVATVDQNGNITAKKEGPVTITATSQADTTKSGGVNITVSPAGPVITVSDNNGTSTNGKAAAWGLTIEDFDANKTYKATFKKSETDTKEVVLPFTGISSGLTVKRVIILLSEDGTAGVSLDVDYE